MLMQRNFPDTRTLLSATWVTVMLLYLAGDVLRIYSGDMARMSSGDAYDPAKWMFAAVFLLIPTLMVFGSLVLPQRIGRALNIVVAVLFFGFVLVDMGSFPGIYDRFLLIVSLAFNVVTVGIAWNWKGKTA